MLREKIKPSGFGTRLSAAFCFAKLFLGVHADKVFYQVRWFLLKPNPAMKGALGEQELVHVSYHTQMWSDTGRSGSNNQEDRDMESHS